MARRASAGSPSGVSPPPPHAGADVGAGGRDRQEALFGHRRHTLLGRVLGQGPGRSGARGGAVQPWQPASATHPTIVGDRTKPDEVQEKLAKEEFDAIYDMNGRELADTKPFADMYAGRLEHYVYMSSAGVYKKSPVMPHVEGDECDPKSRHKGKRDTEEYLDEKGLPWTAIRPTYIYGPLNYNPIESWFFSRIAEDRPICIPGDGAHLTGLGHVSDLANAFAAVLGSKRVIGQVYNIQDRKAVTFDGMARLCARAAGKDPDSLRIVHYDPSKVDLARPRHSPSGRSTFSPV
eukprot:ctg_561.g207